MGFEYRVKDQYGLYFITCTVHQCVDIFTRSEYVDILLDSPIRPLRKNLPALRKIMLTKNA